MKKIILLMGVAGSGKTYLGKILSNIIPFIFIDSDNYHSKESKKKMSNGNSISEVERIRWLQKIKKKIDFSESKNFIVACSALKAKHRIFFREKNKILHIIFLSGNYQLIKKRLQKRKKHFFNPKLLNTQFKLLEPPSTCIKLNVEWPEKKKIFMILSFINRIL